MRLEIQLQIQLEIRFRFDLGSVDHTSSKVLQRKTFSSSQMLRRSCPFFLPSSTKFFGRGGDRAFHFRKTVSTKVSGLMLFSKPAGSSFPSLRFELREKHSLPTGILQSC